MSSSPCGHAKPRAKSRCAPQLTAIASRPGNAPAVGLPHWGSIHTATQSTMGSPGPCPHMPGLLSSDHQKFQVKFAFTALSCKWPASSPEYEAPSFARGLRRRSSPASTRAASCANGTPLIAKQVPMLWNAPPAAGALDCKPKKDPRLLALGAKIGELNVYCGGSKSCAPNLEKTSPEARTWPRMAATTAVRFAWTGSRSSFVSSANISK
jgi:hypothetical protein